MPRPRTRSGSPARPAAAATSLFGRERALADLDALVTRAREGHGAIVLLTGEAGIGKTAVAEAVAGFARAQGFETLFGRGNESAGAPPYWLWVQVLRGWLDARDVARLRVALGADASFVAELLPELGVSASARPALDPDAARFRLRDAIARLLIRSSAERPLFVLLDDVQWADPNALDLLLHLADGIGRSALLLVATCRDGELAPDAPQAIALDALARTAHVVRLAGLESDAIGRLCASAARASLDAPTVEALRGRTGGNPLHVLELVRLFTGAGEPITLQRIETASPPAGIRQAVGRRLDRVSDRCRALLEAASVIGPVFRVDVVAALATDDGAIATAAAACDEAVGAHLLVPVSRGGHAYRFAHDLVREVLYAGLDEPARVRLHLELAELLEMQGGDADERVAELARHYFEARAAGAAAQAAHWARHAGDRARARWAGEEAARQYGRALDALESDTTRSPTTRCELLLRIADALRQSDHARSRESCREAARLARGCDDAVRLARAALVFPAEASELSLAGSFDAELESLLEDAIARLGDARPALSTQLRARLAPARADRLAWSRETLDLARRLDDPETLGVALTALHWSLGGPEHAPERLAIARELIERAAREQRPLLLASGLLAEIPALLELGQRTEADLSIDRLEALANELSLPRVRMTAAVPRALQAFLDGDLEASERRAREVLDLGRAAHSADAPAAFGMLLIALRAEQDRFAELEPMLRRAAADARSPVARLALVHVWAELGRVDEAREPLARLAARRFDALTRDAAWSPAMHFASAAAVRIGDPGIADPVYAALLPHAERSLVFTGTSCFGSVARHLGELSAVLGRLDEAEHWFEQGLVLDARLRAVPWLAWGQVGLAGVLDTRGRVGDRTRARALRSAAREAARRFGLRRALAACARTRRGAATPPPSSG